LGIQAFEPILIEGKAIQLHPLVCAAFNADFDGDQMAVHVPLSVEAQMEARVLMMSTNNILLPASGKPIINPTQDIVLGLYYATRAKKWARGCYREDSLKDKKHGYLRGVFASPQEVRMAYDAGEVELHADIKVRITDVDKAGKETKRIVTTTVGRVLVAEVLPEGLKFDLVNKTLDKKALSQLIDACYRQFRNKSTVLLADRLRSFGFEHACRGGISIAMKHMVIPNEKKLYLDEAQAQVEKVLEQYQEGLITDGERYNKIVDIWAGVADKVTTAMMKEIGTEKITDPETGKQESAPSFNPIYIMADSGARGSTQQIRQLAAMRGLMAKPSGEIIETPITANFREGLTVLQYFISTHGARKGLADTALKTANSGYLTRRLVDVAQDAVVTEYDCGTIDGIEVAKLEEGGETIQPLADRILGRVLLDDIIDPINGEVLLAANSELDEAMVKRIETAGIEAVKIRSVLTCAAKRGICGLCYGRDLARGYKVNIGEAVGIIAAQSIGEPGTQLTMRTFHIGGAAARGKIEQSSLEARTEGRVVIRQAVMAPRPGNQSVIMNRHAELVVIDDTGREREHHRLVYGAQLFKLEGSHVKPGDMLAEWDPFALPTLTEVSGVIKFVDLVESVTMTEKVDEVTGLSRKVVIAPRSTDLRPAIAIVDANTGVVNKLTSHAGRDALYLLPEGFNISVQEGETVKAGDIIGKMPRATTKTQDITGGLPRVAELFEARKPKDHAIISEIDGEVSFGKDTKGKRKVVITPINPDGTPDTDQAREYLIAKGKHIQVQNGDHVRAGDSLMDGAANPHDILRVKGEKELAAYLVNEIQQVYRLQGVTINDKHIEVIVRQMLRRVRVKDPGDTTFLVDEHVEKFVFEKENDKVLARGGNPALGEALLLGITKASLSTESFISASSFQETTKVLTEAAIQGKVDDLRGLKENVIMGRLIPAGTGLPAYKRLRMIVEGDTSVPHSTHEERVEYQVANEE
jgi:DNA-directed RNA polymerase subunit beta'